MEILKEKREVFRVEIRKRQNQQLFQIKRKQTSIQLDNKIITIDNIVKVIQKFKNIIIQSFNQDFDPFKSQLDELAYQDTQFPLELLDQILQLPQTQISLLTITAIINFMYVKGQHHPHHYTLYLTTTHLWEFMEHFLLRRFNEPTAIACVQLICAAVYSTKTLSDAQFAQISTSVLKFYYLMAKWVESRVCQYVQLSLTAISALIQRPAFTDRIASTRALVRLISSTDQLTKTIAMRTLADLCYHGNDYNIGQLIDAGFIAQLNSACRDSDAQIRKLAFWALSNAVLYEKIALGLLEKPLGIIECSLDCLTSDHFSISRECNFFLLNLSDKGNFHQQTRELAYMERLLQFFLREMLDQDTLQACITQFELLLRNQFTRQQFISILQQQNQIKTKLHSLPNTIIDQSLLDI